MPTARPRHRSCANHMGRLKGDALRARRDDAGGVGIRELRESDRPWLADLMTRAWGLPVVSISGVYDSSTLPGFVSDEPGGPAGAVTYHLTEGGCEVVTLNSLHPGRGIGSALLAAVKRRADEDGRRLWLITTNNNVDAIRFYQRRGMDLRALHRDFVDEVRRHKPRLNDHGADGIPFRHALEFAYAPEVSP